MTEPPDLQSLTAQIVAVGIAKCDRELALLEEALEEHRRAGRLPR